MTGDGWAARVPIRVGSLAMEAGVVFCTNVFQPAADGCRVQNPIGLRARSTHGGPLARIEDAELNARFIRGQSHCATQGIDFLDQVPLADPADRRVAAHLAQRFDVVRQQQRGAPHPRRRQRGLSAGMTAADDDDVEFLGMEHRAAPAARRAYRQVERARILGVRQRRRRHLPDCVQTRPPVVGTERRSCATRPSPSTITRDALAIVSGRCATITRVRCSCFTC